MQKQIIETKREMVKKDYLNTINSISNLIFILYKQRRKEEAKKLNTKVVKTRIDVQGLVHLNTLISIAKLLAISY